MKTYTVNFTSTELLALEMAASTGYEIANDVGIPKYEKFEGFVLLQKETNSAIQKIKEKLGEEDGR